MQRSAEPRHYLNLIKARLAASPIVTTTTIVAEYALADRGYVRARLTLANGDFLEVSEYFVLQEQNCLTIEYRHQRMDALKQHLIQRWDNATHFSDLPNAPHHLHIEREDNVIPGQLMSIIDLLGVLEEELLNRQ